MNTLAYLIPVALFLGGLGLAAFIWALRSGQYANPVRRSMLVRPQTVLSASRETSERGDSAGPAITLPSVPKREP